MVLGTVGVLVCMVRSGRINPFQYLLPETFLAIVITYGVAIRVALTSAVRDQRNWRLKLGASLGALAGALTAFAAVIPPVGAEIESIPESARGIPIVAAIVLGAMLGLLLASALFRVCRDRASPEMRQRAP